MQTITVNDRQNLMDVAIEKAGEVEAAMQLAIQNNIGITEQLSAGDSINSIKPVNNQIVQLMTAEKHSPATDGVLINEGIGFWRIGVDFIIE